MDTKVLFAHLLNIGEWWPALVQTFIEDRGRFFAGDARPLTCLIRLVSSTTHMYLVSIFVPTRGGRCCHNLGEAEVGSLPPEAEPRPLIQWCTHPPFTDKYLEQSEGMLIYLTPMTMSF